MPTYPTSATAPKTQEEKIFTTQRAIVVWSFVVPTVAAIVTGGVCLAMYMAGRDVPVELKTVATLANGYLFGAMPKTVDGFQSLASKLVSQ